jgi:stalled ribosome rescue protein Dom34
MAACIVWLDHKEAQIFHLSKDGTKKDHVKKHGSEHAHGHNPEDEKFFHEVAGKLANVNELLIMGPGLAKNHFKAHLENHHHTAIAKSIVGVESVDHPTENQLLEQARKFFKSYDAFH